MKSKVTLIDIFPIKLPSGQMAMLPVPEKKARDKVRLVAYKSKGVRICNVCGAKEGMPHRITGEFVALVEFKLADGSVWCCQECTKFAEQRGYERA